MPPGGPLPSCCSITRTITRQTQDDTHTCCCSVSAYKRATLCTVPVSPPKKPPAMTTRWPLAKGRRLLHSGRSRAPTWVGGWVWVRVCACVRVCVSTCIVTTASGGTQRRTCSSRTCEAHVKHTVTCQTHGHMSHALCRHQASVCLKGSCEV